MNKYIGKICPYCKGVIKETDEIVVCSVCDMPHHKECWIDNQGCTTFGCTGTISTPKDDGSKASEEDFEIILYDEDFPAPERYEYCPKCGAQNIEGSMFCCKCGVALRHDKQSLTPVSDYSAYYPVNESAGKSYQTAGSDLSLLIGPNSSYYVPKFSEITQQGKKASWNWSAFLITPYWMIYRKMYGYGAAVLGGLFLLSLFGGWFIYLLQLAVYIVFGILGNYIYMDSLSKKAAQLNLLSGQYKTDFVAKNGGTNITAAILSTVGYVIVVTIIQLA